MDKKILFLSVTLFALVFSSRPGLLVQAEGVAAECTSICPLAFQPLCATNQEGERSTFQNDCARMQENCQRKTNYQKTSDGPCP